MGPVERQQLVQERQRALADHVAAVHCRVLGRDQAARPEHYILVAPDMLGFGGMAKIVQFDSSPYEFRARHLFALFDEPGIDEKAHFVGNSFGGSLVLQATTRPEWATRMASATSISGTGGPWHSTKTRAELGRYDGTEADMRRLMAMLVDDFPGRTNRSARGCAGRRCPVTTPAWSPRTPRPRTLCAASGRSAATRPTLRAPECPP
jgi:pimeloyl-ACP methyl ester carboxylesterase